MNNKKENCYEKLQIKYKKSQIALAKEWKKRLEVEEENKMYCQLKNEYEDIINNAIQLLLKYGKGSFDENLLNILNGNNKL